MNKSLFTGLVATALVLPASGALASPFYINAGDYGTTQAPLDADTMTASLNSLGWTDTLATSIYLGLTAGSTVIDTNDATTLNSYGIPLPIDPDQRLVSDLNPTATLGDAENFSDTPSLWGASFRGGEFWGLTYSYTLSGEINAAENGVNFNAGTFDIFFEDGTNTTQVLRLDLGSFTTTTGGATYTTLALGTVNFDWVTGSTTDFVKNFFVDVESGKSFYDLWYNGGSINPIAVGWRMDTNIDCPDDQPNCQSVPLASQLTPILNGDDEVIGGYRQTTIDGTLDRKSVV